MRRASPAGASHITMSVAPLLSLGDLNGAMARASTRASCASRSVRTAAGQRGHRLTRDFCRQDPGRADTLLDETAQAVQKASGWHAWKWNMRLSQARAELACARASWSEAVQAATYVIDQSRSRHRPCDSAGPPHESRAAHRLGERSAVNDARAAVDTARRLADPTVLLDCLIVRLEIEGTDGCSTRRRRTAQDILRAVSDDTLRSAFRTSVGSKAPRVFTT